VLLASEQQSEASTKHQENKKPKTSIMVKSAVILEPLANKYVGPYSNERTQESRNAISGDDLPTVGSEEGGPY